MRSRLRIVDAGTQLTTGADVEVRGVVESIEDDDETAFESVAELMARPEVAMLGLGIEAFVGRTGEEAWIRLGGAVDELWEDVVEELDAVGPWEVLAYWTKRWPDDGWDVLTLSRDGGSVQCAKGLTVVAQHSYDSVPPLDVLVYPGGQGTRPQLHDEAQLDWVRRQRDVVPLMTSVCT